MNWITSGKTCNQRVFFPVITKQWKKEQASRCCTGDVCMRQSVNQLYNDQKSPNVFFFPLLGDNLLKYRTPRKPTRHWSNDFYEKESCNLSLNGKMEEAREYSGVSGTRIGFQFHISIGKQHGDYGGQDSCGKNYVISRAFDWIERKRCTSHPRLGNLFHYHAEKCFRLNPLDMIWHSA